MDPEGYPIPHSDSWIPSNLNLSAQRVMVEEARAEGCAWSPSYLNLNLSEECVCPPGQPMIESPQSREQERDPSLRVGGSARTIGEGDVQQSNFPLAFSVNDQMTCTCTKSRGGGEDNKFLSATPSNDTKQEPHFQDTPPPISASTYTYQERCSNVCPGICKGPDAHPSSMREGLQSREGRSGSLSASLRDTSPETPSTRRREEAGQSEGTNDKLTDPLEDVYIWEARSYTGSAESEELEKMRIQGKSAIPKGPGERSEECFDNISKRDDDVERRNKPPSPGDTKYKGGQDVPENEVGALEDVYIWEARSYTGSADSDEQEKLRLVGKAPVPKGPGERSEEDVGGGRDVVDGVSRFPSDMCTTTCMGVCKDLPVCPPTESAQPKAATSQPSEHQVPVGEQRRPCGCRVSSEQLPPQHAAGGEGVGKSQKRPCPCPDATNAEEGAQAQCVCKHCKKKREKLLQGGSQPPQEPAQQVPTDAPQQHTPGIAAAGQPHTEASAQDTGQIKCVDEFTCFCKPTVHDRVEYLTNLIIEGVSPLNEALETIHMKMKSMGFFGNGNGSKSKNGGSGLSGRSGPEGQDAGGENAGTESAAGSRDSEGFRQDPSGPTRGVEPSVAIYIMSPGTALPPNATKIHPRPPEIHKQNATSQMSKTPSALGPSLEDTGKYSEGNTQVPCCQLPCCPRRPKSAEAHSKP